MIDQQMKYYHGMEKTENVLSLCQIDGDKICAIQLVVEKNMKQTMNGQK